MNPCVILAVDQAAVSGWAVSWPEYGTTFGEAKADMDIARALGIAFNLASDADAPLVAVFEDHSKIPARFGKGTATILGMGAAFGRWQYALSEYSLPKRRILKVAPGVWRKRVLSLPRGASKDRCKDAAKDWAENRYRSRLKHRSAGLPYVSHRSPPSMGPHDKPNTAPITDNEAEALCMLHWGRNAPEVLAVLPKRALPKRVLRKGAQ